MSENNIVVTGWGAVTNQGVGKDNFQNALLNYSQNNHAFNGRVPNFDATAVLPKKYLERTDRSNQLALVAMHEAIQHAKLPLTESQEIGVISGNAVCGVEFTAGEAQKLSEQGPASGSKYFSLAFFPFGTVGMASVLYQIKGYSATIESSENAGFEAVQLAKDALLSNKAKFIIAGATEAPLIPLIQKGFADEYGQKAAALLSEASIFFILEKETTAQKRRVPVLADLSKLLDTVNLKTVSSLTKNIFGDSLSVTPCLQMAVVLIHEKIKMIFEIADQVNRSLEDKLPLQLKKENIYAK